MKSIIAQYECRVELIEPNCIIAVGICISDVKDKKERSFTFINSLFDEQDVNKIQFGSIFDFTVYKSEGDFTVKSSVEFRKDVWDQEELDKADAEAQEIYELMSESNLV